MDVAARRPAAEAGGPFPAEGRVRPTARCIGRCVMRNRLYWIVAWAALCGALVQPAAGATVAELKTLLARLADVDSEIRESSRVELMGIGRRDLMTLKQAVRESLPLAPSQKAVLEDIVGHVYLAGDLHETEEKGFLGIRLPSYGRAEDKTLLTLERGVAVVSRIPGFAAYRMLQDGDVILTITSRGLKADVNSPDQLVDVVKSARPGDTLTFEVIRQGRILSVGIRLDAFPTRLVAAMTDEFVGERAERAEAFWKKEFASMMEEVV